ncbi:MAG: hypothetical protein ACK58T_21760, partial [Phycisphaerae bacterium]
VEISMSPSKMDSLQQSEMSSPFSPTMALIQSQELSMDLEREHSLSLAGMYFESVIWEETGTI